jgi:hypothetical protein
MEKGYGRYFLDSLPPAPVRRGTWQEMLGELRSYYMTPPAHAEQNPAAAAAAVVAD